MFPLQNIYENKQSFFIIKYLISIFVFFNNFINRIIQLNRFELGTFFSEFTTASAYISLYSSSELEFIIEGVAMF